MKQKITVVELFSGIGAQKEGINLTKLYDCEVVATSDIDKEVMVNYAAIHCGLTHELINTYGEYPSKNDMAQLLTIRNIGYNFKNNKPYDWFKHVKQKNTKLEKYYLACILTDNLGDISLIENIPYADLWTYSFPCTDISVAGKQEGIVKGETRSGLLYEVDRLLENAVKENSNPKFLLLENVKNLVGKQFKEQFDNWVNRLDELGYNTRWKVVNGKFCGVPQNRERVFAISIRKDIDAGLFEFMKPFDNGVKLKDILEDQVDEKYYISEDKVKKILNSEFMQEKLRIQFGDTCSCLLARDYKDPKCVPVRIGNIYGDQFGTGYAGNVWDNDAICPTLMTMQGCGRQPMIVDEIEKVVCEQRCDEGLRFFKDNVCGTLRTIDSCGDKRVLESLNLEYRVRKLTPKECFRLMGFGDLAIDKCIDIGTSDSQLYKEAGNSIITYCIKLIMEHLYKAQYDNTYICSDENFTRPQVV